MRLIRYITGAIDRLNAVAGEMACWLIFLMVLFTITDVLLRYLFSAGSVVFQEMEWHLYAANFLLAAGWTMKQNGHVRIDFVSHRFGPKTQAMIDILGTIVFCIPFCLIVIWAGSRFFHNAWSIKEMSDAPGGLPARYILKGFIPLGFSLIVLQSIAEVVRNVRTLAGKSEMTS